MPFSQNYYRFVTAPYATLGESFIYNLLV